MESKTVIFPFYQNHRAYNDACRKLVDLLDFIWFVSVDGGEALVYQFNIFSNLCSVEPTHLPDFFPPSLSQGMFLKEREAGSRNEKVIYFFQRIVQLSFKSLITQYIIKTPIHIT